MLGTTISGKPSYFHGLYFQEPYQVLIVKIYERYAHGSGRGQGRGITMKFPKAFSIIKTDIGFREKDFARTLFQLGPSNHSTPVSYSFSVLLRRKSHIQQESGLQGKRVGSLLPERRPEGRWRSETTRDTRLMVIAVRQRPTGTWIFHWKTTECFLSPISSHHTNRAPV